MQRDNLADTSPSYAQPALKNCFALASEPRYCNF